MACSDFESIEICAVLWLWTELFRMVDWEVALANFHKAWLLGDGCRNRDSEFFFVLIHVYLLIKEVEENDVKL